jgi:hypothetical protein
MTDNTAKNKQQTESPNSWADTPAAKFVGAGAAVAATLFTAKHAITSAFFKTVNKGSNGVFADIQNERDIKISEILSPAKKGQPVENAAARVKEVNKTYEEAYKKIRENIKIRGVFDEAKTLKAHQWNEVIFAVGAVASIAVGAILTIASSREAANKDDDNDVEKKGRGV